tara:strand:- start:585 stop:806 length:222 start_codon:yes stop_codon:yes gene_type:complete
VDLDTLQDILYKLEEALKKARIDGTCSVFNSKLTDQEKRRCLEMMEQVEDLEGKIKFTRYYLDNEEIAEKEGE